MANNPNTTHPVSALCRDPILRAWFRQAEDDGAAPVLRKEPKPTLPNGAEAEPECVI